MDPGTSLATKIEGSSHNYKESMHHNLGVYSVWTEGTHDSPDGEIKLYHELKDHNRSCNHEVSRTS